MPPNCRSCHHPSSREVTRASNRKGNAGRPYYKCHRCNKFLCFADDRGNDPSNPPCYCGVLSRRQVAGYDKHVPRGMHFAGQVDANFTVRAKTLTVSMLQSLQMTF
ncbi:hypothetical protein ACJ73_09917 [Blastomyces percursus]|uniref:GRF-like zinc ribbon domain-containing protein n=1 Tax=Blastomyces percursus TaxID=1658174 RepID=A0A1J9Q2I8_9EURO|nr:hypothetical protein ACJ73_09917 [Blastomyces percursus]